MGSGLSRQSITVVAPTPPPYAGPEVSTAHLLASPLAEEFSLFHIRSNLKATNAEKGAFSIAALSKQLSIYFRIVGSRLRGSKVLYVLMAVNVLGFIKDAGSIWLGKILGMRVVAHMKGATLPAFYGQSPRPLRWLILVTVRSLDALIVQAAPIRADIVATFGVEEWRLPVIPNMVEGGHVCGQHEPGQRLLYLGHLSVGKGFVDLLHATRGVFADYPDAVLRCAGEPKDPARDYVARLVGLDFPAEAQEMIRNAVAGQIPQVEYLGLVHGREKEELLCDSDILVLPSYSESFPMAVLEAMNHECAVIATNVGALPEMIADGSEGILIRPGDQGALTSAIRLLLSDQAERARLAVAAEAKVEATFTTEKVVPLYAEIFRHLVS